MKRWTDNVLAGGRWMILLVFASFWVETIKRNLWWILATFVIAGALTGVAAIWTELVREQQQQDRHHRDPLDPTERVEK